MDQGSKVSLSDGSPRHTDRQINARPSLLLGSSGSILRLLITMILLLKKSSLNQLYNLI